MHIADIAVVADIVMDIADIADIITDIASIADIVTDIASIADIVNIADIADRMLQILWILQRCVQSVMGVSCNKQVCCISTVVLSIIYINI